MMLVRRLMVMLMMMVMAVERLVLGILTNIAAICWGLGLIVLKMLI